MGNLTTRKEYAKDLEETFTYDTLNRLIGSSLTGSGASLYQQAGLANTLYEYDAQGNIIHKSDAGDYNYGASGAGPHAVTSITNGPLFTTFRYDANGNQIYGSGRTISYSSFNKPINIVKSTGSTAMSYGPERQLLTKTSTSGETVRETLFINGLYEIVTENGVVEERHNLKIAGNTVAVIRTENSEPISTHYLHQDHLNSVVAITDEAGKIVDTFHYDAFGKRLKIIQSSALAESLLMPVTDLGFTGHMQLTTVGLIHMGGRVYDPAVGRFLSADPHIQSPLASQSYNRYSYVWNNPLSNVDPSGYFSFGSLFKGIVKVFKAVVNIIGDVIHGIGKVIGEIGRFIGTYWRPIVAVVVAVVSYGYMSGWSAGVIASSMGTTVATATGATATAISVGSAVIAGAVAGAASSLVMTGSLEGALKGALVGAVGGALFGGISSYFGDAWSVGRVAASGVAGGIISEVGGGSFRNGFLMGAAIAGIQWGYQGMRNYTNRLKYEASKHSEQNMVFNKHGEIDTYGPRGLDPRFPGKNSKLGEWLDLMKPEGKGLEKNWFGIGFDSGPNRYLNWVSKVHDTFNSWRYTDWGLVRQFQSQIGAELFEIFSLTGMLPAAAYTAVAQFGTELMVFHPNLLYDETAR